MGKQLPKSKTSKEDEMDDYDSQIDELYRPFLIHSTTYALLTEQILTLMPSERNVLLTMNEYDLNDINPMHPNTVDSPTHVIIFCIRFIAGDTFQPIGGLLTYKYKDQSIILAECLKAYINDLWKLGLYVVGTVSPPFECFKGMLSHLVDVKDFNTYSNTLVYSVTPIKEIVHIYDIQFLLIKLQNLFKEGDIKFTEAPREYRACWNDISRVLNLSSEFKTLSNYLSDNKDVSRRIHIFSEQVFHQLLELEAQGVLSKNAEGSAVLLNCIRSFLQFTELDLVDLKLMCRVDGWNSFTNILYTMTFQKSKKRTCTKTKPTTMHVITKPSTRRRIEFQVEENEDVIKHLAQTGDDVILCNKLEENCDEVCLVLEDSKKEETDDFDGVCLVLENSKKEQTDDFDGVCLVLDNSKKEQTDKKPIKNNKKDKRGDGKTSKSKKGKMKDSKEVADAVNISKVDETTKLDNNPKIKLHTKKPYDKKFGKIGVLKKTNTSENEKTDLENKTNIIKENSEVETNSLDDKFSDKTEDSLDIRKEQSDQEETDNKINFSCDRDKNNNSNASLQSNDIYKKKSTTIEIKSNNNVTSNTNKRNESKFKEENFDFVINDAQKFFESLFIGYNTSTNTFDPPNTETLSNSQTTVDSITINSLCNDQESSSGVLNDISSNNEQSYDDFCSQTDEETENCVTKICDKVPTIVESLDNEECRENESEDFEQNDVTCEMLCTVLGMKKLMENLIYRRVKVANPDAFAVEHIDFLVTIIKRDKNKINPVYYYGHNYCFLNAELAFASLQNNTGLYLVKT